MTGQRSKFSGRNPFLRRPSLVSIKLPPRKVCTKHFHHINKTSSNISWSNPPPLKLCSKPLYQSYWTAIKVFGEIFLFVGINVLISRCCRCRVPVIRFQMIFIEIPGVQLGLAHMFVDGIKIVSQESDDIFVDSV